MERRKLRAAILGCGNIGNTHAKAILANEEIVELYAVCDEIPEKAEDYQKKYGAAHVFTDMKEMLADPNIDIVHICTPSGYHADHAVACAKAGKHILCEKPLDITAAKMDQMIEAYEGTGLKAAAVFQYRTYPGIDEKLGLEFYQDEIDGAKQIINALRRDGYEIACYTYDNEPYGTRGTAQIQADLQKWNDEVTPILGQTDLLVFARESDIADADTVYTGEKYETLYNAGFRRFLGFCDNGTSWSTIADDHIRMGRLMVTGANLQNHPEWFAGVFTASTVIDSGR